MEQALALQVIRKRAGLTQIELADRIGKGRKAVSAYESDRVSPTGKQIAVILKACESSWREWADLVDEESEDPADRRGRELRELLSAHRGLVEQARRLGITDEELGVDSDPKSGEGALQTPAPGTASAE